MRVRLFHWNEAEAKQRIATLEAAGCQVEFGRFGTPLLRAIRSNPPQVFVIDLSRLPSHGREVAAALRSFKATRLVPIVFVDGEAEKVARVRRLLPDAVFARWATVGPALKKAVAKPPVTPVVPGSVLKASSGTPLPRKLGIKPGK